MILYKNTRARDLLEIYLISAISGVLLVRLYLHLSGYPQIGGGGFHIAHMLWGGLLMMAGTVMTLAFLGTRSQRFAALIGGLGFGVFIDEIGKFITSDNDYFYQPAVGIIYAIFAILYIVFSFITRGNKLSSREYQLNALVELEEALSHDMDETEKARARAILEKADQANPITKELKKLFEGLETVPRSTAGRTTRFLATAERLYRDFWSMRESSVLVRVFFIVEPGIIILGILATFVKNIDDFVRLLQGSADYGAWLLIGELGAAFIASILAIKGAFILTRSRLEAFELFRLAALINLLLTEFFRFSRLEFAALPGFSLNLVLILVISYAIQQERRLADRH